MYLPFANASILPESLLVHCARCLPPNSFDLALCQCSRKIIISFCLACVCLMLLTDHEALCQACACLVLLRHHEALCQPCVCLVLLNNHEALCQPYARLVLLRHHEALCLCLISFSRAFFLLGD